MADEIVSDVSTSVDFELNSGCVSIDEIRRDSEDELLVPGRVIATDGIKATPELDCGIDPCDCVGVRLAFSRRGNL